MLKPKMRIPYSYENIEDIKDDDPNLAEVMNIAEQQIDNIFNNSPENEIEDIKQYIYEAVMKWLYGEDIFDWINQDHNKDKEEYQEYLRLKEKFDK